MALSEKLLKEIARELAQEADVRAVFGDPLKLGQRTIVPVASVRIQVAFGPGAGRGAATLTAAPLGFVCEEKGALVFKRVSPASPTPAPPPPAPSTRRA